MNFRVNIAAEIHHAFNSTRRQARNSHGGQVGQHRL
jgi:hypothetical protein